MSDADDPKGTSFPEGDRRVHHGLRAVFEEALVLVEPFFDTRNAWGGHSLEHFAFRVLRDRFPELSGEEIHVFVIAARRVYATRKPGANGL